LDTGNQVLGFYVMMTTEKGKKGKAELKRK
jgi:hypothetical protein